MRRSLSWLAPLALSLAGPSCGHVSEEEIEDEIEEEIEDEIVEREDHFHDDGLVCDRGRWAADLRSLVGASRQGFPSLGESSQVADVVDDAAAAAV